jgi:hypothetical protein
VGRELRGPSSCSCVRSTLFLNRSGGIRYGDLGGRAGFHVDGKSFGGVWEGRMGINYIVWFIRTWLVELLVGLLVLSRVV